MRASKAPLHCITPPVSTGSAVEEQGHAFLCTGREEHSFMIEAAGVGALHILGAWQRRVSPHILQDYRALTLAVPDLIPVTPDWKFTL